MSRRFTLLALIVFVALLSSASAQTPKNPILFVTVVPNAQDSATQSAVFCSHLTGVRNAPRGGDLWIRYPDGTLKNLTQLAGYGNDGVQAENSIAVREPSVHWSGTKALFSMIKGSPLSSSDKTKFYWQIYEITGLGKNETPVITKVPNQPLANNIGATYGTDNRIIFTSDRPRLGSDESYSYLDENIAMPTNSGIWSLNAANGELHQLDHSPSGAFSPLVDSYGRVLFTRWDILQQDQVGGFFNKVMRVTYDNEDANSGKRLDDAMTQAEFPEQNMAIMSSRGGGSGYFHGDSTGGDTIQPSLLLDPHCPSNFFPWTVNEDGSNAQTINHIGRHDLVATIPAANDSLSGNTVFDKNLKNFSSTTATRNNKNSIVNFLNIKEDPNSPGTLYGVDALTALTHSGGQIVRMNKVAPTDASNAVTVSYITPRSTRTFTPDGKLPAADHSGFYRNPLPTTDGLLLASHSANSHADRHSATGAINVNSLYNYRLRTLKTSGDYMTPDKYLTSGITKHIVIKDFQTVPQTIEFNGVLWEMDAVEVVARQLPEKRNEGIDALEQNVFNEEKVDVATFKNYLQKHDQALIVSRDITMRDKDDKQQPFYLRVNGTNKQSVGATGKIYDVANLTVFQADYRRSYTQNGQSSSADPRRVVPTTLHESALGTNTAKIQNDGSFAKLVPAGRALSWQLSDPSGKAVVRERYWVTFKAGEIRACVKCHGENGEASVLSNPTPQNESQGLRSLLQAWKTENYPSRVKQSLPLHQSLNNVFPLNLQWQADAKAQKYEVVVKAFEANRQLRVVYTKTVDAPITSLQLQEADLPTSSKQFQWEVRAIGEWGMSETVSPFTFATDGVLSVGETGESAELKLEPNPASGQVQIRFSMNEASSYSIVLTDMLGRDVLVNNFGASGNEVNMSLPLNGLVEGVYIVRVQYAGGEYRRRLVVSR